jgi:hypothetical protein
MDHRANWHQRLNQARGWIFVVAIVIAGAVWLVKR